MPKSQLRLIRSDSHPSKELADIIRHKLMLKRDAPLTTPDAPRSIDLIRNSVDRRESWYYKLRPPGFAPTPSGPDIPSALSMTSRMTYFTDRVLQPEMVRAMAIMYLAESPVIPDVTNDYYLSPVLAPDYVLARFPKTYFMTGEKDPMVDDTVVFASRLRDAKHRAKREFEKVREQMTQVGKPTPSFPSESNIFSFNLDETQDPDCCFAKSPDEMIHVKILEGVSHAFFNMSAFLPEATQASRLICHWFNDNLVEEVQEPELESPKRTVVQMNEISEKDILQKRRNDISKNVFSS